MSLPKPGVKTGTPWRFPRPKTHRLENGLTVDSFDLPGQRIVTFTVLVDAPLTSEPADLEGVASLAMHTCDEGSRTHPGVKLTDALEAYGAAVTGAGARLDGASLTVEVPASHLLDVMPLIGELVAEPAFAKADVARLVDDRLLSIATGEASPPICATKAAYACFGNHRLARPVGGSAKTVAKLRPRHLKAWYGAAVRPNRARLLLAGELPEGTDAAIDAAFGDWRPSHEFAELASTAETLPPAGRRVVIVDRPNAEQVSLRLATLTPSRDDPDWPALQVANAVVGGMFGSRLNLVLREERGLTYGANSGLAASRNQAVYIAQAECGLDAAAEAAAISLKLLDLSANPITDKEVSDAVAYISGATPLRLDTAEAIAAQATEFAFSGLETNWFDDYMAALAKVTPNQATAAFCRHIRLDNLVVALAGPAELLAPQLAKAGLAAEVVASTSEITWRPSRPLGSSSTAPCRSCLASSPASKDALR